MLRDWRVLGRLSGLVAAGSLGACSGGSAPAKAPDPAPAEKRAPCTTDQSCNQDPSVSSLWGHCSELGVCECGPGFELSPESSLCRPVQEP